MSYWLREIFKMYTDEAKAEWAANSAPARIDYGPAVYKKDQEYSNWHSFHDVRSIYSIRKYLLYKALPGCILLVRNKYCI